MTDDVPCRICGASREAHGTFWNHDHRYRRELYCEWPGHRTDVEATWWVNGKPFCSRHKGEVSRAVAENPHLPTPDFDRIDRSRP